MALQGLEHLLAMVDQLIHIHTVFHGRPGREAHGNQPGAETQGQQEGNESLFHKYLTLAARNPIRCSDPDAGNNDNRLDSH